MTWKHHFSRARRSESSVSVDKEYVGPIPPSFEQKGIALNGVWGVYERERGLETVRIQEFPNKYHVSVSSPITSSDQLSQPNLGLNRSTKPDVTSSKQTPSLKQFAIGGIGLLGVAALGKALNDSQTSSSPDPDHVHRVFISHSWQYEEHYQEVQTLLDDASGFDYFDHSVSSDQPIDAQLPNHLRSKLRDQMQSTSVVLVLAGMYVAHSNWIKEEIDMAAEMDKPIIGVVPPENERVPNIVEEHATEIVETDGSDILNAIKRCTA